MALAILGSAGVAMVAQVRTAMAVSSRTERAEMEIAEASEFLEAVALWPRGDLDRHLGNRRNGPWRLAVFRPTERLYEVTIRDSTDSRTLVATTLFRDSGSDAR